MKRTVIRHKSQLESTLSTADYLFRIKRALNTSSKEYARCGVTHYKAKLSPLKYTNSEAVLLSNQNTETHQSAMASTLDEGEHRNSDETSISIIHQSIKP